jgi:hypothetical protein
MRTQLSAMTRMEKEMFLHPTREKQNEFETDVPENRVN